MTLPNGRRYLQLTDVVPQSGQRRDISDRGVSGGREQAGQRKSEHHNGIARPWRGRDPQIAASPARPSASSTARSSVPSRTTTRAGMTVPADVLNLIAAQPWTTLALVKTCPAEFRKKPDPRKAGKAGPQAVGGAGTLGCRAGLILSPRGKNFFEHAGARRTLFKGEYGAPVVAVDHGNVEPAALIEQLEIALPARDSIGETEHESAPVTLTATPASATPRVCSAGFISTPGTLAMLPEGEPRRQLERHLPDVARRQSRIAVAAQRPRHREHALGHFDLGADRELSRLSRSGRHRLDSPDHRAGIALAMGIGRIFLIEHRPLDSRCRGRRLFRRMRSRRRRACP